MTDASQSATVADVWHASSHRYSKTQSLSAFGYSNHMEYWKATPPQEPSTHFNTISERDSRMYSSVDAGVTKALNEKDDAGHPTFYSHLNPHYHRYSRLDNVSELFLAEAKAAQAKVEAKVGSSGSSISSDTRSKIEKPRFDSNSRQNSLSSINAVGPDINNPMSNAPPLISLRVVDDTIQMSTNQSHYRFSTSSDSERKERSIRKPLGLTYALRRTDSGSTFQSLDGLSSSYQLIRNDGKKKQQHSKQRKRSASYVHTSSNWAIPKCGSLPSFDTSRYSCLSTSCFPMDDMISGRMRSRSRNGSSNYQRDSPERSISQRHELTVIQSQPRSLRKKPNQNSDEAYVDTKDRKKSPDTKDAKVPISKSTRMIRKTVSFAAPLVTKIKYRPFTPQSDIAMLYFQEEELEELESDREMVSGDQFECQYDETCLAVRIAYQNLNPADE